jgi:hypothetical protein
MKKVLHLIIITICTINSYSQTKFIYKCENILQRDSIAIDFKNKGFVKYEFDESGLFLCFTDTHNFWFSDEKKDFKEVNTIEEIYSSIKNKVIIEDTINLEDSKEDLCSNIDVKTDKFNDEVVYSSPSVNNISFIKYKKKQGISQYVSISVYDSYLAGYNNTGLTILFKSGKKITRIKEKVDVDYTTGSSWRYSVFFTPTANEINLLKKDEIEAVKLYIFDADIYKGTEIKQNANCVLVTPKAPSKK